MKKQKYSTPETDTLELAPCAGILQGSLEQYGPDPDPLFSSSIGEIPPFIF